MKISIILTGLVLYILPVFSQSYIIPDGRGESPVDWLSFRKNNGQVIDHTGIVSSSVKYYNTAISGRIWLHEDALVSWTTEAEGYESNITDTLFRVDMQPVVVTEIYTPVTADLVPEETTGDLANYYLPHCGPSGIENVPAYKRVTSTNIYPNIHQQVYNNNTGFKFYYIVEPGGDPSDIRVQFTGMDSIQVTPNMMGFYLNQYQMLLESNIAYEIDPQGNTTILPWIPTFFDHGDRTVSFVTGSYNPQNKLVLGVGHTAYTPKTLANGHLLYSSYIAGNGSDDLTRTFSDDNGDIYVAGSTQSVVFPAHIGTNPHTLFDDAVVFKYSSQMKPLRHTYLGTTQSDQIKGAAISSVDGKIYVAGITTGNNLGGKVQNLSGFQDGFVASFNFQLQLTNAQYHGGNFFTHVTDLDLRNGVPIVCGYSSSTPASFPANTGSGFNQSSAGNAGNNINFAIYGSFISEFDNNLGVSYSSWIGGSGNDYAQSIHVNSLGEYYVLMRTETSGFDFTCNGIAAGDKLPLCAGQGQTIGYHGGNNDFFISKFDSQHNLKWGTFIGGPNSEGEPDFMDVKSDPNDPNRLYVLLSTDSAAGFWKSSVVPGATSGIWNPTNNNFTQTVLMRFDAGQYTWHSFLGCQSGRTWGTALGFDNNGNVYVSGKTSCQGYNQNSVNNCKVSGSGFPNCPGTNLFRQSSHSDLGVTNGTDAFLISYNDTDMLWSTYFGGSVSEDITDIYYNSHSGNLMTVGKANNLTKSMPVQNLPYNGAHYQDTAVGGFSGTMAWFSPVLSVSVDEIKSSFTQFNVWPNPATTVLRIDVSGKADYEVFTVTGQKVLNGHLNESENQINVESLSRGTYLVTVQSRNQNGSFKLVID